LLQCKLARDGQRNLVLNATLAAALAATTNANAADGVSAAAAATAATAATAAVELPKPVRPPPQQRAGRDPLREPGLLVDFALLLAVVHVARADQAIRVVVGVVVVVVGGGAGRRLLLLLLLSR
jgi:hypothetical protein